jgi:integrase
MATHFLPYPSLAEPELASVMERDGVYRQPDSPFWMIRFRYKGRLIRESSRTTSRREALAHRRRRMAEFGLGSGKIGSEIPTLKEASEALLSHIRASKKSGHAAVRSHLASLIAHFGPKTRIAEMLPERMERYVTARQRAGLRDSSIYNEMPTLRRCIRLQWHRQRILGLPAFPMPARGRARQGFFTETEVEKLCEHLPAHAINAVRFAWETGWRRGEIFGLRWSDVNLETGIIFRADSKNGEPGSSPSAGAKC